jgi:2-oxoglutarate ferredoxin oxidoreductase subunit gamma
MATKRIFIAGFGGQGILLIGQMLASAAMLEGREVSWMPAYGPEMRGGTANCTVVISDKPIASPIVTAVDVLLAMNGSSLDKFSELVVPGGTIIVNSGIISKKVERTDVHAIYVDCNFIAREILGNEKVANVVMLGALIGSSEVVDLSKIEEVFQEYFKGGKAKMIELNLKAVNYWSEKLNN